MKRRGRIADRVETRFAGSPGRVADQFEQLHEATAAEELIAVEPFASVILPTERVRLAAA